MSDLKISQLPDGAPAITTDIFPIERSFIGNFRLTLQNILTFISTYTFPSLSANTYTSTTINSDSLKATSNVSIAGDLLVTGTTTHTGLVTNNDNVTTAKAVTHNGTTTLNSTAAFNDTAITYGDMTHNAITTFNAAVTRGTYSVDGTGTTFNGPLTTTGATNLATGAVLTGTPTTSDSSNLIATTEFSYLNQFGYGQDFNNVTSSRTFNTVTYHNTGTKPLALFVSARVSDSWTSNGTYRKIIIYVDEVFTAGARIYNNLAGSNPGQTVWAVVPPSSTYRVAAVDYYGNAVGVVLLSWVEIS
jgi:hypothetical protein